MAAARQSETQSRARYQSGLATLVEVADAENLLAQAEMDDSIARLNVWRGLFAVAYAQGDLQISCKLCTARRQGSNSHVADSGSVAQTDFGYRHRLRTSSFSILALIRTRIDIFPDLNLPVIYVAQPYGGMSPQQIEGFVSFYYEYHFLYINGIESVEAKSIQGNALLRLTFHPDTDMSQALAQTISYVNRARAFMPPGTVSPFVIRYDAGTLPVGYLVFSSVAHARRNSGSRFESGAARFCDAAGCFFAAALWRQPAHGRRQRRSGQIAGVRIVDRKCGAGNRSGEQHRTGRRCKRRKLRSACYHGLDSWTNQRPTGHSVAYGLGAVRVPARRRNRIRFFGPSSGLRSGQRQANRLHSGDQTAQRFHDYRGRRGPGKLGAFSIAGSRGY